MCGSSHMLDPSGQAASIRVGIRVNGFVRAINPTRHVEIVHAAPV